MKWLICWSLVSCCRGADGAGPFHPGDPSLAVGGASYGLQTPVDAHPLRNLQLPAGKKVIITIVVLVKLYCFSFFPFQPQTQPSSPSQQDIHVSDGKVWLYENLN